MDLFRAVVSRCHFFATQRVPFARPLEARHTDYDYADSDATIGDHVEALLGWFIYLTSQYDFKFGERVHGIIDMLNQALFSAWVLGTFFPSSFL